MKLSSSHSEYRSAGFVRVLNYPPALSTSREALINWSRFGNPSCGILRLFQPVDCRSGIPTTCIGSSDVNLYPIIRFRKVCCERSSVDGFSSTNAAFSSRNLKFSAPPLRSLRLCGECSYGKTHRRAAEDAETAQRRNQIDRTPLFFGWVDTL